MQKLRVILFAVGAVMSASASLAGPNDETRTIDAPPDQLLALLVESGGAGDPAQETTDISTWFLSGRRRPSYRGQQTDDRCYRRRAGTSEDDGSYRFDSLPIGYYQVHAERSGFSTCLACLMRKHVARL